MVDNCSISSQSERARQPHAMIPHHQHHHHHHHHTDISHDTSMQALNSGANYRSQEARHSCGCCSLPHPGHHPISTVHNEQAMHCSNIHHTEPPVSHMHSSYTVSGAPANSYNVPSGPIFPCDPCSTPAGSTNNNYNPTTVPLNSYSAPAVVSNTPTGHTVSYDNYNTLAGPILHSLWFLALPLQHLQLFIMPP